MFKLNPLEKKFVALIAALMLVVMLASVALNVLTRYPVRIEPMHTPIPTETISPLFLQPET